MVVKGNRFERSDIKTTIDRKYLGKFHKPNFVKERFVYINKGKEILNVQNGYIYTKV